MVKNPEGKSPPVSIFEHVTTDHNIKVIRQTFFRFKDMETRLLRFSRSPAGVVTDSSKAIIQVVLQEYTNEITNKYLSRLYRIATGVSSDEENKKTHVHICSFHFIKLNSQFLDRLYGKTKEESKKHFCLKMLGRLICCGILEEAIRICKHASIIMTNKKVRSAVKQSLSILQEIINEFDVLQGIENNAGTCLTEEVENDLFGYVSSPWKDMWEKELMKLVTKNDEENILEEDEPQKQYVMDIYFEEFKHHLPFIAMWTNISNTSVTGTSVPFTIPKLKYTFTLKILIERQTTSHWFDI